MFREMRRKDRMLSESEAMEILSHQAYGVLALEGTDGYPYGVPSHYVLKEGQLYFHGSKTAGLKAECIERNHKVCFTVIEPLEGVKCRSVIVFGYMEQAPSLAADVLSGLIEKFVPQQAWEQAKSQIPVAKDRISAWRMTIEHISAKVIDKPDSQK